MNFPRRFRQCCFVAVRLLLAFWLAEAAASAAEFRFESVGVRGGFSANESGEDFGQAELTANWRLPWRWDLGADWGLRPRLDASLGWLGSGSQNGAISTLGPSLVVTRKELPFSFEGGISPTLLSRYDFDAKNFGANIQFTSHFGVNWEVISRVSLGYRFQHMSNAGLSAHNPGLNLHMFGVSYSF